VSIEQLIVPDTYRAGEPRNGCPDLPLLDGFHFKFSDCSVVSLNLWVPDYRLEGCYETRGDSEGREFLMARMFEPFNGLATRDGYRCWTVL